MNPLLTMPAIEIARLIREREVTITEVIETYIDRIEQVNPHLNAVVRTTFDGAREVAARRDRLLREGKVNLDELPPFYGVPCTLKEYFNIKGLPATAGLKRRINEIGQDNAPLVMRMKDAGFILLGITNVPEGMTWFETYNKVYGRTSNAYSIHHTPGGSTGGEAAIIGAAGSPIGIGGDIGGSVRQPAFFNGICAHKSTGGTVPGTGTWPYVKGQLSRYKQCGPIARSMADIKAIMPLLAGPDGIDQSVDAPEWGTPPAYKPEDITVYWFDTNNVIGLSNDMQESIEATAKGLAAKGYKVEFWRPQNTERTFEMWTNALEHAGGPKFIDTLADFKEPVNLFQQWLKWPLRKSDHIFPCLALATLEAGISRFPKYGQKMANLRLEMREEVEGKLGDNGVLVFPTFHRTAPKHGVDCIVHFLGFTYCAMVNPMELPATAVPTGFGRNGLPLGVQAVAKRHNDHLTIHMATEIEGIFGGWKPGPIQGVFNHADLTIPKNGKPVTKILM